MDFPIGIAETQHLLEVFQMQHTEIKAIEDLSLNAWPSHQMQLYDGWILRFSYFYTHRTNCVEQFGSSVLPLEQKIPYCEGIYRRWKSPCIFKITPLSDPDLDRMLAARGYEIQNKTYTMCMELDAFSGANSVHLKSPGEEQSVASPSGRKRFTTIRIGDMTVRDRIPDEWIDALFAIKGNASVTHLKIVPSMYAAIPKDVRCVYIRDDEKIVATGLGILDRDYIGVYAINVEAGHRRRGFARKIVETLLSEGKKAGAKRAYLQVVADNVPAIRLYEDLGFSRAYTYWFRVKSTIITSPADDPLASARQVVGTFPSDFMEDRGQPSWDQIPKREEF